jgi:nudix motif 8
VTHPITYDDQNLRGIESRLAGLSRRRLRGAGRKAAVLVPLCDVDGEPAVLFTRRSETVGTHKGQVSFPGGMADPEDPDLVATALREFDEELGGVLPPIRILGLFHDATAITGVHVTPVLAYLGAIELRCFSPNPDEIDHVFALGLRDLVAPEKRYRQTYSRGVLPVFDAGPFPIWGLTAYILEGVLEEAMGIRLDPPTGRPAG